MANSIKDILNTYLENNREKFYPIKILGAWDEIIGDRLAPYTLAKNYYDGVLSVDVKEKEWKVELSFHGQDIIDQYKKRFPDCNMEKIVFRYNPHFEKEIKDKSHHSIPSMRSMSSSDEKDKNGEKNEKRERPEKKKRPSQLNRQDEIYSIRRIRSEFLLAKDEFQPFDLYE